MQKFQAFKTNTNFQCDIINCIFKINIVQATNNGVSNNNEKIMCELNLNRDELVGLVGRE